MKLHGKRGLLLLLEKVKLNFLKKSSFTFSRESVLFIGTQCSKRRFGFPAKRIFQEFPAMQIVQGLSGPEVMSVGFSPPRLDYA
jgi:hypothetical protein